MIRRITLDDLRFHDIPGWPGYQANRVAQVRSLPRRTPAGMRGGKLMYCDIPGFEGWSRAPALLKQRLNPRTGRYQVKLFRHGRRRMVAVHILVARTFLGERPPGQEVCHLDEDKRNNWARNLAYDTPEANRAAYLASGRPVGRPRGSGKGAMRLTA
jgi:hypothetical protein